MATFSLSDTSRRAQATGNGSAGPFSFSFQVNSQSDLKVYVDTTLKTLTTHYTVTVGASGTGSVSFTSGNHPTSSQTVTILSDVPVSRTSVYTAGGNITASALESDFDTQTMMLGDREERESRTVMAPVDDPTSADMTLPGKDTRKGKVLGFNATTGNPEAGPEIADVQSLAGVSADIQTLAHIEDGTDATDAIQTVAGIASNVSTVAGVSSAVSTVAGISSNVSAVAADATDIGVVAGKATEIGRLGTSDAVADLAILGTSDAVSDMNTLAAISSNISTVAGISANVTSVAGVASLITSDFVADLNTLATTDIVSDLNTLATADIVSDLNTLATSDIVSDLNTLATADIVSDLNTLATTDIVSDLNTLATTDIVTDLNLLATSAIVEDLNLLATSTVIADMATLAGAGANPNISSLGVSGIVTAGGLTVDTNTLHVDATNNRVGIGTSSPSDDVEISTSADAKGLTIKNAGNNRPYLNFDANRSGAGNNLAQLNFKWNGTDVARIIAVAGSDTTNKDDGHITFNTSSAGSVDEAMRITSARNVGIGTSSPVNVSGVPDLTVAGKFFTSDGTETNPAHSFTGDQNTGIFRPAADTFAITTGGSEAMRIDSSGNLLVGKTSTSAAVAGVKIGGNFLEATTSGGAGLALRRLSSDGDMIVLQNNSGTTVGSIGTSTNTEITFAGQDAGIGIIDHALVPTQGQGVLYRNSTEVDLGRSDTLFKDLYLSGSIEIENGTGNVGVGKTALNSTTGANNTAIGFEAGYSNTTGVENTFLGRNSGYYVTGNKNTIVGAYAGNQGGLDIRHADNQIVLSDGDGNPRLRVTSTGQFMFPGSATPNPHTDGSGVMIYGTSGIMIGSDNTHALIAARHNSNGECIRLQRDNTDVGSIDVTTSSTSYNTTSDYRLKENVVELTGATDRLKQLNPSRFNFIVDADTTVDGFLAHEVQSVVPEAITGTHNEVDDEGNPVYQGIDQSKLVPLLVATIKELEARITALENA